MDFETKTFITWNWHCCLLFFGIGLFAGIAIAIVSYCTLQSWLSVLYFGAIILALACYVFGSFFYSEDERKEEYFLKVQSALSRGKSMEYAVGTGVLDHCYRIVARSAAERTHRLPEFEKFVKECRKPKDYLAKATNIVNL
jgi:hypothetical protein